ALAFAATPILFIALVAGVGLRMSRVELIGLVLNPFVLSSVFVLNLIILAYRFVAIVDAYRVAEYMNAHAAGIATAASGASAGGRRGRNPLSIIGLIAIILVMAGSHVVVARYDMLALSVLDSGCIFIGDEDNASCTADATPSPGAGASASPEDVPSDEPSDAPEPSIPQGSALPQVSIPPWNGTDRLNILLIGSDQRPGDVTHNTDTLIVVSIDPATKDVVMFSLPRDTVDVPLPPGPARRAYGSVYTRKINAFWSSVRKRDDLFPGDPKKNLPGYNGLKAILGNLYGLDIKYFVEVNFDGFRQVVDQMGGVTINVQMPVTDDRFPSINGSLRRIYIPSGIQHMDGTEALRYARSRHGSNDFDRGIRQQRVLLSLREQADPQALIPRLPNLVQALQQTVKTDIPVDQLAPLLGLASEVDTKNIRSYVFSPPFYQKEFLSSPRGYIIEPNIPRIRAAVREAFTDNPSDEAERQKLADEGADLWVLNGTADASIGPQMAGYLDWNGINASAPRQKPPGAVPATTTIVAYNGALADNPETVAYLQKLFGITSTEMDDPAIRTDFILTVGKNTPRLEAPLAP
ncbi:MAG TPA: LCP family protein, partial [Actinomycetota bacterium]|nr:LCP family protein [Actinomycetota bacterium]